MSILTYILGWPLLAALALMLVPRNYRVIIRAIAVLATLISAVLAVKMFCQFVPGANGYQFEQQIPWVESLGISYHVGVDGLNVGLILMGAIVAFAAALCSWEIQTREKEFYILLLVMSGGILGAFASLDLFFFYFLHELALVPTFIMIGVWGRGEQKNYATFQITLYLSIGALIALIGLIALYLQSGANTFDIPKIIEHAKANPLAVNAQNFIFPLLLFGFGILVSLWPFHSWAPLGYGAAPSPTAMLHAGVLKKFGLYGLIRIALPLMPQAAHHWMNFSRVALPRQHSVCRLGGDAAEGPQPAHRQFERGAHGLHLPWHRQPEPHWRDRRGAHHDCARLPRGADVRVERLHLPTDRHVGDEQAGRTLPPIAVHRHGAADGGDGGLRTAGLCEFRRRSHRVLRRVEGFPGGDSARALGRVADWRALHAAGHAAMSCTARCRKNGIRFPTHRMSGANCLTRCCWRACSSLASGRVCSRTKSSRTCREDCEGRSGARFAVSPRMVARVADIQHGELRPHGSLRQSAVTTPVRHNTAN